MQKTGVSAPEEACVWLVVFQDARRALRETPTCTELSLLDARHHRVPSTLARPIPAQRSGALGVGVGGAAVEVCPF